LCSQTTWDALAARWISPQDVEVNVEVVMHEAISHPGVGWRTGLDRHTRLVIQASALIHL
jgi:hypothetical protein